MEPTLWEEFIAAAKGPVIQAMVLCIVALITLVTSVLGYYSTRFMASKVRDQEAKTDTSKLDSLQKFAEVIIPSLQQKAKKGVIDWDQRKPMAQAMLDEITPKDIKPELVDHVIEATVLNRAEDAANPPVEVEGKVKLESE